MFSINARHSISAQFLSLSLTHNYGDYSLNIHAVSKISFVD